jgi:AbrB family looped-hinge helix DNA binding protein
MEPVTISSKYQVVIPREIREQFDLKPGQKIVFFPHKKTLRVIIIPPIEEAEGFLKGIDTNIEREEDDRI